LRLIEKDVHLPVEIFGFIPEDRSEEAKQYRRTRICPFIGSLCVKKLYRTDEPPTGSCTVSHKGKASVICPNRFLEDDRRLLKEAVRVALPNDSRMLLIPEVGLPKGFGRVDWVGVKLSSSNQLADFVAIELQANQTTSTGALTNAIKEFERTGTFSRRHYGYGLNGYMQIKTFFTQCLNKGRLFSRWQKKYVWIIQDVIYEDWTSRFQLKLDEGSEKGTIVFMVYDLVFDDASGKYRWRLRKIVSSSHTHLLEAYSQPARELPPPDDFVLNINDKIRQLTERDSGDISLVTFIEGQERRDRQVA